MVNSSWTRRHIVELWWRWHRPMRVYPPCDTRALQALPLDRRLKRLYLVSVAQFRWAGMACLPRVVGLGLGSASLCWPAVLGFT